MIDKKLVLAYFETLSEIALEDLLLYSFRDIRDVAVRETEETCVIESLDSKPLKEKKLGKKRKKARSVICAVNPAWVAEMRDMKAKGGKAKDIRKEIKSLFGRDFSVASIYQYTKGVKKGPERKGRKKVRDFDPAEAKVVSHFAGLGNKTRKEDIPHSIGAEKWKNPDADEDE
jgi:hypothetical protein